jgi:hypothetical protein
MPTQHNFQLQGARNRALKAWRLRHIDPQYAEAEAKRALDIGFSLGDFSTSAWATLSLAFHAIHAGTNLPDIRELIKRAMGEFAYLHDIRGLTCAWALQARLAVLQCDAQSATPALESAHRLVNSECGTSWSVATPVETGLTTSIHEQHADLLELKLLGVQRLRRDGKLNEAFNILTNVASNIVHAKAEDHEWLNRLFAAEIAAMYACFDDHATALIVLSKHYFTVSRQSLGAYATMISAGLHTGDRTTVRAAAKAVFENHNAVGYDALQANIWTLIAIHAGAGEPVTKNQQTVAGNAKAAKQKSFTPDYHLVKGKLFRPANRFLQHPAAEAAATIIARLEGLTHGQATTLGVTRVLQFAHALTHNATGDVLNPRFGS